MKKVIITGANGFLGSALCRRFLEEKLEVIAIVKCEKSDISSIVNQDRIRIVFCDSSDYNSLPDLVEDRDIDAWFHLAWEGTSGPLRGDYDIQIKNIRNTCDAIRICSIMQCKRFVFANSIMAYEVNCMKEQCLKPDATSVYSAAKLSADSIGRSVSALYGIEYISAIISNIYGPGEKSPRLINSSIRKLLQGEYCSFSEAEQLYDFVYIDDAVDAFLAIGENGIAYKEYYIGNEKPRKLKTFLFELRDCVNKNVSIGIGDLHFEGVSLTYREFDTCALCEDTGFKPKVDFRDGIIKTIKWIQGAQDDCV